MFDEFDHLETIEQQAIVINQFYYRDLDGLLFPPRAYTRELQAYALQQDEIIATLQQQITDLEGKLARTGNQYYQKDAGKWGKAWTDLNISYGKLQGEMIAERAKFQAEIDRLKYQNQQLKDDLEAAEERMKTMQAIPEKVEKSYLPDRNADGTFKSVPKTREQLAAEYSSQGLKNTDIAELLNVSPDTVARYIRKWNQIQNEKEQVRMEQIRAENDKKESQRWSNFENYGFTY